ncbi:unnamed protein product [Adineta steineri]|uniref:Uncharacterized protein n=1 Tax=Adineta steineri TaxID=433720 RepID=A0A813T708_9BILA|nr:unnamed protein product [Adineta steineri]
MPGTMTENEHLLSLVSIEVLISHVHINLNIECHLPCIVFRLLDYPAVSIPYFDQWQIEEFHNVKRDYPNISWRQLLSDQFYELRSANGKFNFKRGKSCLFKTYFKTLYTHLLNVPLFLLLIDQINDNGTNDNTTQFIGSCNIKLNELIEMLNQSIIKNGKDIPLVEQQTFYCTLFNLMGTQIGTCNVAVRFCHYGTTILTQLPMLDDKLLTKIEQKAPIETKKNINEKSSTVPVVSPTLPSSEPPPPTVDTIVKHIHFVNEKKDVGLQISRSDLPLSTSNHNKSAQTRWTSTKTYQTTHHSKSRSLRTIEDPLFDDISIASYQPPPLYFNSNSDFLQMITPINAKSMDEAKENRLSYLASIPIASFNNEIDIDDDDDEDDGNIHMKQQRLKSKSSHNVRFNLSSPSVPPPAIIPRTKIMPKQPLLTENFLQNFPLLRALVEEALALQQHDQFNLPLAMNHIMTDERPHSTKQPGQRKLKQSPVRPKSATMIRSVRTKSVIVARNINNTRRLYPPPPETRQMVVTKNEVRSLVDRLSKPKFNKRLEQQVAFAEQGTIIEEPIITPRLPPKTTSTTPTGTPRNIVSQKPPLSYGTTRAHRLYAEYSRARRAANQPQPTASSKPQITPRKESSSSKGRIISPSPQLINTGTLSNFSLLNKVDIDTATIEKNSLQQISSEQTQQNTGPSTKSSSTTSQDVTLELNQHLSTTSSTSPSSSSSTTTPEPTLPEHHHQPNNERNELGFSITDVTDYFTDGDKSSSSRPTPRQST